MDFPISILGVNQSVTTAGPTEHSNPSRGPAAISPSAVRSPEPQQQPPSPMDGATLYFNRESVVNLDVDTEVLAIVRRIPPLTPGQKYPRVAMGIALLRGRATGHVGTAHGNWLTNPGPNQWTTNDCLSIILGPYPYNAESLTRLRGLLETLQTCNVAEPDVRHRMPPRKTTASGSGTDARLNRRPLQQPVGRAHHLILLPHQ